MSGRGALKILDVSIIPFGTFVMATYDGGLGALILVTIGSIFIWAARHL